MTGTPMRTSETHPIRLDGITIGEGQLSLTLCPGKSGSSQFGGDWDRDLQADATRLHAEGVAHVVSLIEEDEGRGLGVADLGQAIEATGMTWERFPIRDTSVPSDTDRPDFEDLLDRISAALDDGAHVVVHCRGGLGRAGTVAASVLVRRGMAPDAAMARVRAARPGAIENARQEAYVADVRPAP